MSIYAISDLHLSTTAPKPMDIFGPIWRDHEKRVAENWDAMVASDDIVLVAGDDSWATKFEDALPDLAYIAARPGRKIIIRGNHDYWWRRESTGRIQKAIDPSIHLMHGRGIVVEGIGITGTRGWRVEDIGDSEAGDRRVLNRELGYLERGLREIPSDVEKKIVILHYPPFNSDLSPNEFAALLQEHKVDMLVYGHVHSGGYMEGDVNGVHYRLVSVDHTGFRPVLVR